MSEHEQQDQTRRPYAAPEVRVYGRVEELTNELGSFGQRDNGIKRTHSRSR